jgi:hypothetical protein
MIDWLCYYRLLGLKLELAGELAGLVLLTLALLEYGSSLDANTVLVLGAVE